MRQKLKGRVSGDKRILRKRGRNDIDKRKKSQQKKE